MTKMELIRQKKCIWCRNKGHNCKDCRIRQAKRDTVTAAYALSVRRESRPKGFNEDKIKERPHDKETKIEETDFSKVLVKGVRYPRLVLLDLQMQEGDLIDSKFVHFYCVPTI